MKSRVPNGVLVATLFCLCGNTYPLPSSGFQLQYQVGDRWEYSINYLGGNFSSDYRSRIRLEKIDSIEGGKAFEFTSYDSGWFRAITSTKFAVDTVISFTCDLREGRFSCSGPVHCPPGLPSDHCLKPVYGIIFIKDRYDSSALEPGKDSAKVIDIDSVKAFRSKRVFTTTLYGYPYTNIHVLEGPGVIKYRYWAADVPGSGLNVTLLAYDGSPIDAENLVARIDAISLGSGTRRKHATGGGPGAASAPNHPRKLFSLEKFRGYFDAIGRAWR